MTMTRTTNIYRYPEYLKADFSDSDWLSRWKCRVLELHRHGFTLRLIAKALYEDGLGINLPTLRQWVDSDDHNQGVKP